MITVKGYTEAVGGVANVDRLVNVVLSIFVFAGFVIISIPFLNPLVRGFSEMTWQALLSAPTSAGARGGIAPIIVSTFFVIGLSLLIAVPISFYIAAFLSEFGRDWPLLSRVFERSVELLAALPSIVYGLVGNALFCVALGFGYSILSGSLTLALMISPFMVKSFHETLRGVSDDYRLNAAALSISKARLVRSVLLPSALPALVVGCMLGLGRALAETAALLFTSGYSMRFPESILDSGRVLSVHIYDLSMNVVGGEKMAYLSSAVLVLVIIAIGATSSGLMYWWRKTR